MAKKSNLKIITANDLVEGDVIYFTQSFDWSRNYADALIVNNEEQELQLLEKAQEQQGRVIFPYLVDVAIDGQQEISLLHFREKFRSSGPSNYFHGKQEIGKQENFGQVGA